MYIVFPRPTTNLACHIHFCFTCSPRHLYNISLLSTYFMPGPVLPNTGTMILDKVSAP